MKKIKTLKNVQDKNYSEASEKTQNIAHGYIDLKDFAEIESQKIEIEISLLT